MFAAFFRSPSKPRHHNPARWLRGVAALSMAFSVSACAYDGTYYSTHSGSDWGYSGSYHRDHNGRYYSTHPHGFQHRYQPPRYDHYRHPSRRPDARRKHDVETYRFHFESKRHFERKLHETRKRSNAHRGHPHVQSERRAKASPMHRHHRQHSHRQQRHLR